MLRARHVACAAGVWTDRLRELAGGRSSRRIVPSKGIHVFVAGDRIPMDTGVLARTEKSVLFIIPWQGGWLIGDTDTPWTLGPDQPVATGADVDYLLAKTNALLAEPLTRDDVHGVTAGLRPLVAEAARSDTTRISRRHVVESPAPGLTTIAGGKYTTYRVMAADLVDAVARALGTQAPSVTRDVPSLGAGVGRVDRSALGARAGLPVAAIDGLLRRYGDRVEELVALIEARPELAEPLEGGGGHLRAEVVHACTHEGALRLEDVLERRTRLALTAGDRGLEAAAPAAALMAGALGWDPERDPARGRGVARARRGRPRGRGRAGRRARARRVPRERSPSEPTRRCGDDRARPRARPGHLEHSLRGARRRARASAAPPRSPSRRRFPRAGLVEQDPEAIADVGAAARSPARWPPRAPSPATWRRWASPTRRRRSWSGTGPPAAPSTRRSSGRTGGPTRRAPSCAPSGHEELVRERTGLELDATFPATKLRWLLDHVDGARAAAEAGRLAYGDVASLAAAPARRASTSPTPATPAARCSARSAGPTGTTSCSSCSAMPAGAAAADRGLGRDRCDRRDRHGRRPGAGRRRRGPAGVAVRAPLLEPGAAKVTLGTGAFVLAQAGDVPPRPPAGVLASCAWRREATHQLRARGLHPDGRGRGWTGSPGSARFRPGRSSTRCSAAPATGDAGVVCVPALQGLGTPDLGRGRARAPCSG